MNVKHAIIGAGLIVISLSLFSIYLHSSFAQVDAGPANPTGNTATANEIDIATGAGGSANAVCVATNNCFDPNVLTVVPGTTVTWKNTDTATHVVCSGKASDDACGKIFEEDSLRPGKTFQFTFANVGTYDYFCSVHPWMTGQVIVADEVSNTPHIASTSKIPNWVKSVFGYYAQGNLTDDDIIKALQFLIQRGIIKIS